ncbi:MAG: DUF839 domain-containing protein [Planctomycetes bacterium]|nr:DUF839 domain-containing protein [Planctomycetota bacterium]
MIRTTHSIHAASLPRLAAALAAVSLVATTQAQAQVVQGPSSSRTPYLVPATPAQDVVRSITSIVTTTDLVPTTGAPATPYEVAGILDGLGAFDNGDGTVTLIANHEFGSTAGGIHRHGARGAFLSELILDKTTLAVVSAQDLIDTVIDLTGTERNALNGNGLALNRFCSSDLADVGAFYNAASGLGTQERVYLCGEEGGSTGYAVATVATGTEKGRAWLLGQFNLATNGSGINAVGGWENLLASPHAQDLTIVAGTNDGGTGVMNNTVNIYVGTKQATGNPVERAGLTNGALYFVNVLGNPVEIVNSSTRATNITSGTRFTLQTTSGTTFSRPEDGAWDPTNPRDFWFVTTDRLDTATNTGFNQTVGASGPANQTGKSRLWRLRFDDIRSPLLGGEITLVIDGTKNNQKVNMLDNMCVAADGMLYLTEDPGNSTYLGKTWAYDPITDTLVQLVKFDSARWGELAVNGGTPGAIAPYTNDKEISGVVDVTHLFPHAADETVLLLDVQDHSSNAAVATPTSVEGGQLLLLRVAPRAATNAFGAGCGLTLAAAPGSRPVLGNVLFSQVTGVATGGVALMMAGFGDSFLGVPLPIDLAFLDLPGCNLYQDLAFGGAQACQATGPATALHLLPVPPSFEFAGLELVLQAWVIHPLGLQTSNGMNVKLGL